MRRRQISQNEMRYVDTARQKANKERRKKNKTNENEIENEISEILARRKQNLFGDCIVL